MRNVERVVVERQIGWWGGRREFVGTLEPELERVLRTDLSSAKF
jgi:hypothetical protein